MVKIAKLSAFVGLLMIILAGILAASDHLQRDANACSLVGQLPPAQPDGGLQVLDVSSTDTPRAAVLALGKPLCVTVANVRPAAELDSATAEVATTKAARDETAAELRKARAELRTVTGDARKAADSKVKDLAAQVTQESEALNKAIEARAAVMRDVELALFINDKRTPSRATAKATAAVQSLRFDLEQSWDARSEALSSQRGSC